MSSTLIVRDATLAINGVTRAAADPGEHFRERVHEARRLDRGTVVDCAEVLRASLGASGGDAEVLEALLTIALAHPEVAREIECSALTLGRRLAARLERSGEPDRALAILNVLHESVPGDRALERDISALMRRQGMAHDLVARYEERANALLAAGKPEEAVAWLREVLLLDRRRADVARRIRDLRQRSEGRRTIRRRHGRGVLVALLVAAGGTGLVRSDLRVTEAYRGLPHADQADVDAMGNRLLALERFIHRYPVWHGSLAVLQERNELKLQLELQEQRRAREEKVAKAEAKPPAGPNQRADEARERGYARAEAGDFPGALQEFVKALDLADDSWDQRERTELDVASIREHLKEGSRP